MNTAPDQREVPGTASDVPLQTPSAAAPSGKLARGTAERITSLVDRHQNAGILFLSILIPLKLSWTYVAFVPSTLLWLIARRNEIQYLLGAGLTLVRPGLAFLVVAAVSSLFGIHPFRSLFELAALAYSMMLTLMVFDACRRGLAPKRILSWLVAGQAIASFHSILDSSFPDAIPPMFVGKLTESGQLALIIPIVLAAALGTTERALRFVAWAVAGTAISLALVVLGFWHELGFAENGHLYVLGACILALLGLAIPRDPVGGSSKIPRILYCVVLPLLMTALLVNLKRGPWAGVALASLILLAFSHRWALVPVLLGTLAVAIFVGPVRTRLEQTSQHFFIPGGRNEIWSIGGELATRYPLGIGYRNGNVLRSFSPRIPPELRHFHNNTLNLIVETGPLATLTFLWWFVVNTAAAFAFRGRDRNDRTIALGIGGGLIAWQAAGIVEYNLGDREVTFVVFLLAGILMWLVAHRSGDLPESTRGE